MTVHPVTLMMLDPFDDDDDDRCCAEDYGGSHYHCGTCGKVSGMMGCPWENGRPICAKEDEWQESSDTPEDGPSLMESRCTPESKSDPGTT